MKLSLTFKTPDVIMPLVYVLLEQLPAEEREEEDDAYLLEELEEDLKEKLSKWIEYGELVTIEFDLEAGTAKVLER